MATKTATHIGSSWVILAIWSALIAIAASYYYSHETIRKVNTLIEGLQYYVKVELPRRE